MLGVLSARFPHRLWAEFMLFLATFLWSTSSVALRWLVGEGGVEVADSLILAVRFSLAAGLVALWRPQTLLIRSYRPHGWIALWLGLLMGASYFTQIRGLETIGAARSHFITNLTVVIVPMMQVVILRRRPGRSALTGLALALVGLILLTRPFGGGLRAGDFWTLGCALVYGLYMIELQRLGPRLALPHLLMGQFVVFALMSWVAGGVSGGIAMGGVDLTSWVLILYLAIFCSFWAVLLHNRFQHETTPARAALLFAAGPVMTFSLSWLMLGELLSPPQIAGAALILVGILTAELFVGRDRSPQRPADRPASGAQAERV